MALEGRFTGREEKRVPVTTEVKLVRPVGANAERQERAVVENISALGARVYARIPWQLGEKVEVTPAVGGAPLRAEVVYCQKQSDGKFAVGLKFRRSPVLGSLLEKVKKLVR
jgi:PilZ domain-containing protein